MADIITTLHPENNKKDNLYPNIKSENIPTSSISSSKLTEEVNSKLTSLKSGSPAYVGTESQILALNEDKGMAVANDTGYWYYWNGSQYISSELLYQSTGIQNNSIELDKLSYELRNKISDLKFINVTSNITNGWINGSGGRVSDSSGNWKNSTYIPCYPGEVFRYIGTQYGPAAGVTFYDDNHSFISNLFIVGSYHYNKYDEVITIPSNCRYVAFCANVDTYTDGVFEIYRLNNTIINNYNNINKLYKIPNLINGYYDNNGVLNFVSDVNWLHTDLYPVETGDKLIYNGFMWFGVNAPLICLYNSNKELVNTIYKGNTSITHDRMAEGIEIIIPENVKYIAANFLNDVNLDLRVNKNNSLFILKKYSNDINSKSGKTAVWFGTSIPNGYPMFFNKSYPELVSELLDMKIYNEAVGASMCRAGDYTKVTPSDPLGWTGLTFNHIALSLSMTVAEKNEFIDNYETKWKGLISGNPPEHIDDADYIRSMSYENKLLKYLKGGSIGEVDYYIFDHGHNDNLHLDTGSSELMTAIPNDITDRTYFIGSYGYLFKKIWDSNPHARIFIIGHYENSIESKIIVSEAQKVAANIFELPLNETWKKTGWNQKIITTNKYWNNSHLFVEGSSTNNLTMTECWMADNLHPGSDASGEANMLLAKIHANFIKNNY